jgi:hypothetical protein
VQRALTVIATSRDLTQPLGNIGAVRENIARPVPCSSFPFHSLMVLSFDAYNLNYEQRHLIISRVSFARRSCVESTK